MKTAIYDNPHTFRREAYQDGRLRGHIDLQLLLNESFLRSGHMPFIFNVGSWQDGRVCGDEAAIPKEMLST